MFLAFFSDKFQSGSWIKITNFSGPNRAVIFSEFGLRQIEFLLEVVNELQIR
jgi:hypothetical protein